MIKYFVRTTNERQLDNTYNQVDYELLVDLEHKPIESFIKQLEILSEYDSVLLEDDLILCKDFKNRIEEVIKQYPDKIINFFTAPNYYFKTKLVMAFGYNQCTYYPKGISKEIALMMKKLYNKEFAYDDLEQKALIKLNLKHIQYRPCLVQHLDYKSIISKGVCRMRVSPYFIDYLDELGITYEEAELPENKTKLMSLMKSHFDKVGIK